MSLAIKSSLHFFLTIILFFPFSVLPAQDISKKVLGHEVYDSWKDLKNPIISNDGKWVSFEITPQKGDGWLYLVDLGNHKTDSVPRGYEAKFSPSSGYMAFKVKPAFADSRQAKKDKKKEDEMPKDSLGLWLFKTGKIEKFPEVQSFSLPDTLSSWMVYRHYFSKDTSLVDTTKKGKILKQFLKSSKASRLVAYDPLSGKSREFDNVSAYVLARDASSLVIISQDVKNDTVPVNNLHSFSMADLSDKRLVRLEGKVSGLCMDRQGRQLAFLNHEDSAKIVGLNLYYWAAGKTRPEIILDSISEGMVPGWGISRNGGTWFSYDGTRLYLGIAPKEVKEKEDSLLADEKYQVDIWNWKDELLQPMQKVQLSTDKKKTYLAVHYIGEKGIVQLADNLVDEIRLMHRGNGDRALGFSNKPYQQMISWASGEYRDVYLINCKTGEKEMLLKKKKSTVDFSSMGRYIVWYETADSNWYSHEIESGNLACLTCDTGLPFYDVESDVPADPPPYGIAGWTEGDEGVLIYDQYDVWKFDPQGVKHPINLTNGWGRNNFVSFRYRKLEPDINFIPVKKPLVLYAYSDKTKQTGIYTASPLISDDPEEKIFGKYHYSINAKARDAGVVIWQRGNFKDYPDLVVSGLSFKNPERISFTNPQAADYFWGEPRLVHWTSFDRKELDGILYIPENFDPAKKYPMLVYFYERSSGNMYTHRPPSPSRSTINIPYCVSNGYVVFMPDIVYRDGYPGQSAYDAVVSGTMAMLQQFEFIDKDNMAIQGQSWGGYQVAYLITRTNLYKAAMAGAPVSNMTSAYGGIRWESGMSRMFQYEQSQSRIGGTLWDRTGLYLENSPVFYVPRIETPVLIMHNDKDGAVPWYQGIEFFVALRRLQKPAWLLVYNDEAHNLTKWPNRVDLSIRMMQFFDHYLKDAPEPEWMKAGLPAIDKGRKDGYMLTD